MCSCVFLLYMNFMLIVRTPFCMPRRYDIWMHLCSVFTLSYLLSCKLNTRKQCNEPQSKMQTRILLQKYTIISPQKKSHAVPVQCCDCDNACTCMSNDYTHDVKTEHFQTHSCWLCVSKQLSHPERQFQTVIQRSLLAIIHLDLHVCRIIFWRINTGTQIHDGYTAMINILH